MILLSSHEEDTSSDNPMMQALDGWHAQPLFTVGDSLPDLKDHLPTDSYRPVGGLDGIGVVSLQEGRARVFVNHEIGRHAGYPYRLKNGVRLTGARISFFDINLSSLSILNSGLAYDQVYDRRGFLVTQPHQINESNDALWGFSRFCSSQLIPAGTYNFTDTIYFAHEEARDPDAHPHGGTLWALNIENHILYAVPAAGRMSFENVAPIHAGPAHIALLIGDDTIPQSLEPQAYGKNAKATTPLNQVISAPLWLYVGKKLASSEGISSYNLNSKPNRSNIFLNRNGLLVGKLFYFVMNDGIRTVSQFHGTGNNGQGSWKELAVRDIGKAAQPGYDADGYKNGLTLRREAKAEGAFQFSRPEDLSTHPLDGNRVVFASTGHDSVYPDDSWGTVYEIQVDPIHLTGTIRILYDGDDQGGGQFTDSDEGLRNPDNLDWGHDGFIYIQEDKSKTRTPLFGNRSKKEASIWKLDPKTGKVQRIAHIDRTAIGVFDRDRKAAEIGAWESSGILDVSRFFTNRKDERLLLTTVQAHSLTNAIIQEANLVEGGQLLLLRNRPF